VADPVSAVHVIWASGMVETSSGATQPEGLAETVLVLTPLAQFPQLPTVYAQTVQFWVKTGFSLRLLFKIQFSGATDLIVRSCLLVVLQPLQS
jgi:hypothetical protein